MRNRVKGAWRALRGRRIFALASVGGIAALLLGTLGASTAVAHGIVTSGEIQNQTIQSVDIGADGVGQSEIRNGAVDSSEIEDQSINSWDIGAEQVGTSEIRDGSVQQEDLAEGVGGEGPQGPPGEDGQDGGLAGYEIVGVEERVEGGVHEVTASCTEGKVAIGGGFQASADGANGANTQVFAADFSGFVDGAPTSYTVAFDNSETTHPSGQGNMRVRVTCANQP